MVMAVVVDVVVVGETGYHIRTAHTGNRSAAHTYACSGIMATSGARPLNGGVPATTRYRRDGQVPRI